MLAIQTLMLPWTGKTRAYVVSEARHLPHLSNDCCLPITASHVASTPADNVL